MSDYFRVSLFLLRCEDKDGNIDTLINGSGRISWETRLSHLHRIVRMQTSVRPHDYRIVQSDLWHVVCAILSFDGIETNELKSILDLCTFRRSIYQRN
jgi:hypothetical protein